MPPETAYFIVNQIIKEAATRGIPLSEIESKMLFFSETSPTLLDIAEVNHAFERDYDQLGYERKIVRIIRLLQSKALKDPHLKSAWEHAAGKLGSEDYYVQVMLNEAMSIRPRGDLIRVVATALLIVSVIVSLMLFFKR